MNSRDMSSYSEALFAAQRGFLIVGLSGFTGAGCTRTARILASETKIALPPTPNIHPSGVDKATWSRRYKQIREAWDGTPWGSFTVVEVAAIIFGIISFQLIRDGRKISGIEEIQSLVTPSAQDLHGLKYIWETPSTINQCEELVGAYELALRLMRQFKTEVGGARFIKVMQEAGDRLRLFGRWEGDIPRPNNILFLPEAIRRVISSYKKARNRTRFVVDSFRNPFEVEYFKRRYAEFYLMAIVRNKEDRMAALRPGFQSDRDIINVWRKENGEIPCLGKEAECSEKSRENFGWWVTSQNIPECIQKADIVVLNREGKNYLALKLALAKLLALSHKPGCFPPSDDERAMQFAVTAKLMSGCLSRQVGASVVGAHKYIMGIGWNDPAEGQIPCSSRTCEELLNDPEAEGRPFSAYERSDEFVLHMEGRGIRGPFCFKSEYEYIKAKKDNLPKISKRAELTRALHAEENAFLQTAKIGGTTINGSTLYTTASPCVLCAKKAYQLGVSRIVFIEKYPDIAYEQIIESGDRQISYDQFEGVTGHAYFCLYSPLISEKDLVSYYQ